MATAAATTPAKRLNTCGARESGPHTKVRIPRRSTATVRVTNDCFTQALELLRRLPDEATRDSQELDLQMGLSESSFVAIGLRAL
jgi:hypothetical protein